MTTRTTTPKETPKLSDMIDIPSATKRCVATNLDRKPICNNQASNNNRNLCNFHNWEYLYSKKEQYTEVK